MVLGAVDIKQVQNCQSYSLNFTTYLTVVHLHWSNKLFYPNLILKLHAKQTR